MRPTYHIVSHSHWDREWYFPFERFRAMLVDMVEDLIELFDKDTHFRSYTLDGQMAAVMDYLEIRPDRAGTIRQLVQQKKLFIGPWYILNDEFLSSGESHIRNLLLGHQLGAQFGGVMRIGYIPDQFGHIAQMPQILLGFDIDTAIIYRGFGGEKGQEPSEYWWISPDGSRVLMSHMPKDGYSAGYFASEDAQVILQKFERLRKELDARAGTSQRLFFNGGDHHWPDVTVTKAIGVLRKHYDAEFIHSNYVDYFEALKCETRGNFRLPELRGETRFGYRHAFAVLGGVFSSRMYLKQMNVECQTLLERYLEPLNAIAWLGGMRSRTAQIWQAWKYVLQCQDHDAICGTSVDEVHQEMVVRFKKAKQIGEHVMSECFAHLFPYDEDAHSDDRYLFVCNPSPFSRTEVVETEIAFYLQDIVVGLNPEVRVAEKLPSPIAFQLLDAEGHEVPYQVLRHEEAFGATYSKHGYPHQTLVDQFHVLVEAKNIPSMGWKRFAIRKTHEIPQHASTLVCADDSIENQFLKVEARPDGTVKITDKTTRNVIERVNVFEDSGDVGDEYTYSYPEKDEWYYSHNFPVSIGVVERGPLRAALEIRCAMDLPKSATTNERGRHEMKEKLDITTTLFLAAMSRRVDVRTVVHNKIKDHRLRVVCATGIDTNNSFAETPFAVVEREHREYDVTQFPFEHPAKVAPMQRFVSIQDGAKGFTLIAKGLPEYELKLDDRGTLALTLLRCVGKLSGRDLITRPGGAAGWWNETPEAQCLGRHEFEYSFFPHAPSDRREWGPILKQVEEFTVLPLTIKRKNEQSVLDASFLSVTPDRIQVSALKEAESHDGVVVRVHNPVGSAVEGMIHFSRPVRKAFLAKLNEDTISELNVSNDHDVKVELKPYGMATMKLQMD